MLGISIRSLAMMVGIANSFCLHGCRTRRANTSLENFIVAKPTPECPSGIFRIQCADGHWEYQNLAALEAGQVCPTLQITVLHNTTLRALLPDPSRDLPAAKENCQLSRGLGLQALAVSSIRHDQTRRLILLNPLHNCSLTTGYVEGDALELRVDQYTLSASESFPADLCRVLGQMLLHRWGRESQSDKGPWWGQCSGRYKESHCAAWEEIPVCALRNLGPE